MDGGMKLLRLYRKKKGKTARMLAFLCVLMLAAVLAAGCGGKDDDAGSADSSGGDAQTTDQSAQTGQDQQGTQTTDQQGAQTTDPNQQGTQATDPNQQGAQTQEEESGDRIYIADEEVEQLFSAPDDFTGKYVRLTGKVFAEPQYEGDVKILQIFNNPKDSTRNFIATVPKDSAEVKNGDYVMVDGKIKGTFTGTNAVGGVVSEPQIEADTLQIASYIDVVSPTEKTLSGNIHEEQFNCTVTITSVEFAADETRVYATVKNGGMNKFYLSEVKLIQNGKQYDRQTNFDADYEEVQTELLAGTESSGIFSFPAIDQHTSFQIYMEGTSDNLDEKFAPYQFDVTMQ